MTTQLPITHAPVTTEAENETVSVTTVAATETVPVTTVAATETVPVTTEVAVAAPEPTEEPIQITSNNAHQYLGKTVSYWYQRKKDNLRLLVVGTLTKAGPTSVTLKINNLQLKELDKETQKAIRWPYYSRGIWSGPTPPEPTS